MAHATEVLILQHPLEVGHAKNSAGLLQLSLAHSQVVIGETFDAATLRAVMREPKYTVLLYPQTPQDPSPVPDVWLISPRGVTGRSLVNSPPGIFQDFRIVFTS